MYPSAPPHAYDKDGVRLPPEIRGSNYPAMQGRPGSGLAPWSTGLCHCFDDPGNSLITCCCPCVTFGQIAEILDKGECPCVASGAVYALLCAAGLGCCYSCFYRSKLRAQYDLDERPIADFLVHFCCEPCALCQEYRELKNRGFDLGIGWDANMDRQRRGVMLSPVMGAPAVAGMTR